MRRSKVAVYYNVKKGYIVTSLVSIDNLPMYTEVSPVVLGIETPIDTLGSTIRGNLDISRRRASVTRDEMRGFSFWHVSGIKGFASFSRQYKCIELEEDGAGYTVTVYVRAGDGSYVKGQDKNSVIRFPSDTTMLQLAEFVQKKLVEVTIEEIKQQEFITLNNSHVMYAIPAEGTIQAGDSHTDCYQTIISEAYPNNYILFCIDNNYDSMDYTGIKKRWSGMFGKLSDFRLERMHTGQIQMVVTAKATSLSIRSYFFVDGESLMEVIMVLDSKSTPSSKQILIRKQFQSIIDSITIKQN